MYAAGTIARDQVGDFDMLVLKITPSGSLVWQRQYTAGNVADARGGMAAAADGSIVLAGALQAPKAGIVDITALMVKFAADGTPLFDNNSPARPVRRQTASRSHPTMDRSTSPARRPAFPANSLLAGVAANPAHGASIPNGSTVYGGNFEAALVRIAR